MARAQRRVLPAEEMGAVRAVPISSPVARVASCESANCGAGSERSLRPWLGTSDGLQPVRALPPPVLLPPVLLLLVLLLLVLLLLVLLLPVLLLPVLAQVVLAQVVSAFLAWGWAALRQPPVFEPKHPVASARQQPVAWLRQSVYSASWLRAVWELWELSALASQRRPSWEPWVLVWLAWQPKAFCRTIFG